MDNIEWPAPVGTARSGQPYWDLAEVAAWRQSLGVSQDDLARHLHKSRPWVARYEATKQPEAIQARVVLEMMSATEYLAKMRAAMIAEGADRLAALKRPRKKPITIPLVDLLAYLDANPTPAALRLRSRLVIPAAR